MSNDVRFPLSDSEYKQRQADLAQLVSDAYAAVKKATDYADKYRLSFCFDVSYGMGGTYYGDPEERDEYQEDGWYSSSQSC